jgi:trigger factor
MNISRENIDALNGTIRVSIEKADYEAKVAEVLKDYRKKVSMPGFRPGKVPAGLVNKMYGKAALVDEVNKLLTDQLSKYLYDEKLNILGEPLPNEEQQKQIDWEKDTDFEFIFDIGFAPEVKVNLDKRSKYPFYSVSVTEEMINNQVEAYASRFGANQPTDSIKDKETVRGNLVQLDADGNELDGGASAEMAMIAINLIKDEEEKSLFVGKKVDEEVVFDLKKAYPNDTEIAYLLNISKEEAANVEGKFKMTIKEIHEFVSAEVNEELFKKIYGENTEIADEVAFRAKIVEEIKDAYKPSGDYKFANDTREALVNKINIEFPEAFLKRWITATNKELTEEQIKNDFPMFIEDLKWQLIKDTIIKENELKVDESEIIDLARQVAASQFRQYGMFDIPVEHLDGFAKQMLEKKEDRNRLYNKKMEDKIMEVVKSKVTIDEKVVSKEDYDKLFENN